MREDQITVKQALIEERIARLAYRAQLATVRLNTVYFNIGRLLVRLRDRVIPKGNWDAYLGSEEVQRKLLLSKPTLYRCVNGYEQAHRLMGEKVIAELQRVKLDPGAPKVIGAALNVLEASPEVESETPEAIAGKIAAVITIKKSRKHAHRRKRIDVLLDHAVFLYRRTGPNDWQELAGFYDMFVARMNTKRQAA